MKRQLGLLLVGIVGVVTITSVATAQMAPTLSTDKAYEISESRVKGRSGPALAAVNDLNLTTDQEVQIDAIRDDVYTQMSALLDENQLATFQTAMSNGDDLRSVVRGLGLDRSEMMSLRDIVMSADDDIMEVLTPAQRTQLEGERPLDRN